MPFAIEGKEKIGHPAGACGPGAMGAVPDRIASLTAIISRESQWQFNFRQPFITMKQQIFNQNECRVDL
jgi:hypothetical protein